MSTHAREITLGTPRELTSPCNPPVVYLLDEYHGHDASTDENIANAMHLVKWNNVKLIGTEHFCTGYFGDTSNWTSWHVDPWMKKIGEYVRFAQGILGYADILVGVDSEQISTDLDLSLGMKEFSGLVADHPYQELRTEHFLRSLLQMHDDLQVCGDMILNCGSAHNNHIEKWIKDGIIMKKTARNILSFVRIRPLSFPV